MNADCRGMVLASVLIMMGLIIGMVIHSQMVARFTLKRADRSFVKALLRAAATDAAWNALRVLTEDADLYVNHTNEPWASPVRESLPNGIETEVVIRDEQRLFDINNFSAVFGEESARRTSDIVSELLEHCDVQDPFGLALELNAWFHAGSHPPGRLVESPAELGRMLDLEPWRTESVLGILPHERTRVLPVNINTACPIVLRAVIGGRDDAAAEAICGARDARPFTSLARVTGLIGVDRMNECRFYLDVKSRFFSVSSIAKKGDESLEIRALARRNDEGEFEILRWVFR